MNKKQPEYRLYSFVHAHITSLQKGLQTAHVVGELFTSSAKGKTKQILNKWAASDKTIIILSGGNTLELEDLSEKVAELANELGLPHAYFKEDKATLNESMTAVGIVIPDFIYGMNLLTADDGDYPEKDLKELIAEYRLAI